MPMTKGGVMMGRRENARRTTVNLELDRAAANAKARPMRVDVQLTKTARPRLFHKTRQKAGYRWRLSRGMPSRTPRLSMMLCRKIAKRGNRTNRSTKKARSRMLEATNVSARMYPLRVRP
jgi:hypothetical protein